MRFSSLVDILEAAAQARPDAVIYSFVSSPEDDCSVLTFGELRERASAIAFGLGLHASPGDRILVLFNDAIVFVTAIWGCIYGGLVAVPVPGPVGRNGKARLEAVAQDCGARVAVTGKQKRINEKTGPVQYVEAANFSNSLAHNWSPPLVKGDQTALLQYTSGSTGKPKGVMVTHNNLLWNADYMEAVFELTPQDRALLWLPLYHDMGLMGGVIQPVYSSYSTIFFPAAGFMERPLHWLELISDYQASISGGPDFAYFLCAQTAARTGKSHFNLSSWRVAFNGSEPVRLDTMQRFAKSFAAQGFRLSSFRPCYGLAEATLLVSCANMFSGEAMSVDSETLERRKVRQEASGNSSRKLVNVGMCAGEMEILIVDPHRLEPCAQDEGGEIWVRSPGVAAGYWRREEETQVIFQGQIKSEQPKRYLRTGDLGFIKDGLLYVTGRFKDLILVRGRNYYPQDIEEIIQESHPAFRRGHGAAFGVEVDGAEQLVIVQEVERRYLANNLGLAIEKAQEQLFSEAQVAAHEIILVRPGGILKTTSGKVRRRACRDAYLADQFDVVVTSRLVRSGKDADKSKLASQTNISPARGILAEWEHLDASLSVAATGIDSLRALELKMAIESATGKHIPVAQLLGGVTVGEVRCWMQSHDTAQSSVAGLKAGTDQGVSRDFPLSAGQQALWFIQQTDLNGSLLSITRLVKITGPLNREILRAVFTKLVEQHPGLRLRITSFNGEPRQYIAELQPFEFTEIDVQGWQEKEVEEHVRKLAQSPLKLNEGPLRVVLYQVSSSETILAFSAHHIAVDLWSFSIIVRELAKLYEQLSTGTEPSLTKAVHEYRDYVSWQSALLASEEGVTLKDFWSRRLATLPAALQLPMLPKMEAGGRSESRRFVLPEPLMMRVKQLANAHKTTLYSVLLAVLKILLYRYSGQDEFLLGVLTTGRSHAAWKDVVGYFVNPVIVRAFFGGNPGFGEYLQQSAAELLEAIDHADYPFPKMAEHFKGRHGRSAPVQVMCMLQPAYLPDTQSFDLASFIMGACGSSFSAGDVVFSSQDCDFDQSQFDLTFVAAERNGKLLAAFQYDASKFSAETIANMAKSYITLAEGVCANPELPVDVLAVLNGEREQQVLYGRNWGTAGETGDQCIHSLIEQQALKTPEAPAVTFRSMQMSYRELEQRANQLARYLLQYKAGPETPVGIYLERSHETIVAILATLKTGAAYVPLDPEYPRDRTETILADAGIPLILTHTHLRHRLSRDFWQRCICIDECATEIGTQEQLPIQTPVLSDNIAYLMHTSGSTGQPKGVMISHRNVVNFFEGITEKIRCGPGDILVAVTSISFDISVLELLWTLSRGCHVVVAENRLTSRALQKKPGNLQDLSFSLFYFASSDSMGAQERYRLLIDGAKLADQLGFEAVWTPERHFHPFGGLYPNPSVTSAALATITHRVKLRAGSVVIPLQDPIRVAEEWALVDNLSNGRTGIAFASGWHADDFVFFPAHYEQRREVMLEGIEKVRRLWRGEMIAATGGSGKQMQIGTFPRPLQPELPAWLTSGGSKETFVTAARIGTNILTHLLGQETKELRDRISLYHKTFEPSGVDPSIHAVTLMLHTYIDESEQKVREKALEPFKRYLDSSVGLIGTLTRSLQLDLDITKMTVKDREDLLAFTAERYMGPSGLFGTIESCAEKLEFLAELGVTEIACLVDFGVETQSALNSIERLGELKELFHRESEPAMDWSPLAQALRHGATMLQCTPSFLRAMAHDPRLKQVIGATRALMLGGEPVPASLINDAREWGAGAIFNMYGPTETTIWSAVAQLEAAEGEVFIRGPIRNTQMYILNGQMLPLPFGLSGEVYIGGAGVSRGYLGDAARTAERFLPDPFGRIPGGRIYRTGDVGKVYEDGSFLLAGRTDQQVKLRGHRIELGDIEAHLNHAPGVQTGVVIKKVFSPDDERLIAFIVVAPGAKIEIPGVREFLRARLPEYMLPAEFYVVSTLPLTANGKINRKALDAPERRENIPEKTNGLKTDLEAKIASIWKQALRRDDVSADENFFDIGGHSLLMVQIHHKLQEMTGMNFPLIRMLEHPSIRSISSYLDGAKQQAAASTNEQRAEKQRKAFKVQRDRTRAMREPSGVN